MLRVLTGFPEKVKVNWLRGTVKSSFTYRVEEDWFNDDIVRQALYEIDGIVDVMGLALKKEDGRVIPPDWLSHGCKQFISMTRNPSLVCNSFYFGWNVYKFFHMWSEKNNKDVTILLTDNSCINEKYQLNGVFLNTGKAFSSNRELANMVFDNRQVILSDGVDGVITARKFIRDDNDEIKTYGKDILIRL